MVIQPINRRESTQGNSPTHVGSLDVPYFETNKYQSEQAERETQEATRRLIDNPKIHFMLVNRAFDLQLSFFTLILSGRDPSMAESTLVPRRLRIRAQVSN